MRSLVFSRYFFVVALGVLMFAGCSQHSHKNVVDMGINVNELYQEVYKEYKLAYDTSSAVTQKKLKEEIAPMLDDVSKYLHNYNLLLLNDQDDPQLRRKILMKLFEIEEKL